MDYGTNEAFVKVIKKVVFDRICFRGIYSVFNGK